MIVVQGDDVSVGEKGGGGKQGGEEEISAATVVEFS
jgi:hypothetical protein